MGNRERIERNRRAKANAGAPGGLAEELPVSLPGRCEVGGLSVEKPVERDGRSGLVACFLVHTEELSGTRLVVETTLHGQLLGPLPSRLEAWADGSGVVGSWRILKPEGLEPSSARVEVFFPFEAIGVEVPGTVKCFVRVRVVEEHRGQLAEAEAAFELVAG